MAKEQRFCSCILPFPRTCGIIECNHYSSFWRLGVNAQDVYGGKEPFGLISALFCAGATLYLERCGL